MAWTRFKWKCVLVLCLAIINVSSKSLPLNTDIPLLTSGTVYKSAANSLLSDKPKEFEEASNDNIVKSINEIEVAAVAAVNRAHSIALRNNVRPGQKATRYAVELTFDGNSFKGRAAIELEVTQASKDKDLIFHAKDIVINSVEVGLLPGSSPKKTRFSKSGVQLKVFPEVPFTSYNVIIEFSGQLAKHGLGLYRGQYDDETYLAMNLHPVYARRVFPCMDEPTQSSIMKFTFRNLDYTNIVTNSELEENSEEAFKALESPPHLWGMVAHNLAMLNSPAPNVAFFSRTSMQESLPSVAINVYFNALNEWTDRSYVDIIANQNGNMNILALPDVSRDWHSLSTVGIWEPYIMMQNDHSVKQRSLAFTKIAEGMARQWFGGVIYPRNWAHEWVTSGLATYAAYEVFKQFQSDGTSSDVTLLDAHTLFVTEVIQESLLLDSYSSALVLEPENIFEEDVIRDHIHGLLKYKAPAILRMFRLILGDADTDFIHEGAKARLNTGSFLAVDSNDFIDSVNSYWLAAGGDNHEYIKDAITPWITNNGYPVLNVVLRNGGVFVSQERFGFSSQLSVNYEIPISFTTSVNPNFVDTMYPFETLSATGTIDMDLNEDDWVIFNIQGQGYYRVNYDNELWERLIEALSDPERREEIHPLNRATLIDDALNLARGRRLGYDIAFNVVLTMEHETEYAAWRAFVRNMDFLRKRLIAMVTEDEDLDPDIYLRMVRRTIGAVESELGFSPETNQIEPPMETLTRALVMQHACKANYQPCVAAAVDMFYDADDNVNPNIPHDIRPAVYCTMVREGDEQVIEALMERLEIEPTQYERVVILESLACSQDSDYVTSLLEETVAANNPYVAEERVKIFNAVAESSFENARIALDFIIRRTNEIRNMYGGPEKLEEVIFVLADNMASPELNTDFRVWVQAQDNNLAGSQDAARRAQAQAAAQRDWDAAHLQDVYDWIDENHASTYMLSFAALLLSLMVTLLNH